MIKDYRAWDKITKQMCPVWGLEWTDRRLNSVTIEVDGLVERIAADVNLMEATGVCAMENPNHDEIFEDDIVEIQEDTVTYGPLTITGIVRYDNSTGMWMIDFQSESRPLYSFIETGIKIVGNTYQNPDITCS